jgi:hypothetical protein
LQAAQAQGVRRHTLTQLLTNQAPFQYLDNYRQEGRVILYPYVTSKPIADVLGKHFLLAHGHHIMGQLGIPYYGMQRDKAREAVKRMNMPSGKKFG